MPTFTCPHCGQSHTGLPDVTFLRPDALLALTKPQRAKAFESDDGCVIPVAAPAAADSPARPPTNAGSAPARHFLRGVMEFALLSADNGQPPIQPDFAFGLWVEVDRAGYESVILDETTATIRTPFKGTLATSIPEIAETLGLAVRVEPGNNSARPLIYVTDTNHELATLQKRGISLARALDFVHAMDEE